MGSSPGLNFPADARLAPEFGSFLYARWLRVVLTPDVDLTDWIHAAHALGLKVLGVIANESLHNGDVSMTSVEAARFYRARYGSLLDKLQVGNEPDHVSPSSWTMSPQVLNHFLAVFSVEFPDTAIVCGGMADGRPEYLDDLDTDLYDEVGVQCYGQRPNDDEDWSETPGNFGNVQELLPQYVAHSGGKPVAVTEIGLNTREVSEAFQARYVGAMLSTLMGLPYCTVAIIFCADDAMVPDFGLFDDQGNPKPSAAAFMRAAKTYVNEPEPKPKEPIVDHESVLSICLQDIWQAATAKPPTKPVDFNPDGAALAKHWRDHIAEMGPACGPERYTDDGHAYQGFVGGVWKWSPDNGVEKAA